MICDVGRTELRNAFCGLQGDTILSVSVSRGFKKIHFYSYIMLLIFNASLLNYVLLEQKITCS